jgi:hypothetical protein
VRCLSPYCLTAIRKLVGSFVILPCYECTRSCLLAYEQGSGEGYREATVDAIGQQAFAAGGISEASKPQLSHFRATDINFPPKRGARLGIQIQRTLEAQSARRPDTRIIFTAACSEYLEPPPGCNLTSAQKLYYEGLKIGAGSVKGKTWGFVDGRLE